MRINIKNNENYNKKKVSLLLIMRQCTQKNHNSPEKKLNLLYTKCNFFSFFFFFFEWNVTCFHQISPISPIWSCFCWVYLLLSTSNSTNPHLHVLLVSVFFTASVVVIKAASISVIFSLHFSLIKFDPFNLHADWLWRETSRFFAGSFTGEMGKDFPVLGNKLGLFCHKVLIKLHN